MRLNELIFRLKEIERTMVDDADPVVVVAGDAERVSQTVGRIEFEDNHGIGEPLVKLSS